jgi:hypothetical protein
MLIPLHISLHRLLPYSCAISNVRGFITKVTFSSCDVDVPLDFIVVAGVKEDYRHIFFTKYNHPTRNIFNTLLYIKKTPTHFDASLHHLQGVLLVYESYQLVKIQSIVTYT